MQAQLIPVNGGEPITLERDITVVGRKKGLCELVIDAGSISKLHCMLIKTDGLIYIRDLASTNGTRVNGQKVTRGALLPGDEVAFASVRFRVHLGPPQPGVPAGEATDMLKGLPAEPIFDDDDMLVEPDDSVA